MKRLLLIVAAGGILLGCQSEAPTPECQLMLRLNRTSPAQCDQANGTLTVLADQPDVRYRLASEPWQDSGVFENLSAGDYPVTAQNPAGCTVTDTFTVAAQIADLSLTTQSTASSCDQAEGKITITTSGGAPPYTYRLGDADFQSEAVFEQLAPQTYLVTVQDRNGCTTTGTAHVSSGITLEKDIRSIIDTNCALRGCHGASGRDPNFTIEENILDYAERIGERTSEGSMPPQYSGRSLTPEEIAQIACWVNEI